MATPELFNLKGSAVTAQPDDSTHHETHSSADEDRDDVNLDRLRHVHSKVAREEFGGRNWGISAALYALRSHRSWGIGDFADLLDLAAVVAGNSGDYVIVSPIVSSTKQATQRWGYATDQDGGLVVDPLHIRPEHILEVAYLPTSQRTMLDWGGETIKTTNPQPDAIDFDAVWEAKKAALEVAYSVERSPVRQFQFEQFIDEYRQLLSPYIHAVVAAESEEGQTLFDNLNADSSAGAEARRMNQERINFYLWVQWVGYQQLMQTHMDALAVGMRIGLIHTFVDGLDPDTIAQLSRVGGGVFFADPDAEGFVEAVEAAHNSGLVVFVEGRSAQETEELVRDGVIPRTTLRNEYDGEVPRDLTALARDSMISVARTQDVPTAAYLAEEHIDLLQRLGMLNHPYEQVRRVERIKRTRLLAKVREAGFIDEDSTERQLIEGLHKYITLTPARFITASLGDGVGDRRPLALGGGYPDWTYPYTDGAGAGVLADELITNARFISFIQAIDNQLRVSDEQ